jgi:hypothetical protein
MAASTERDAAMIAPFDARLRATLASVAACGAVLTLGSLPVLGPARTISVATGAALAAANLWVLARIVTALLPGAPPGDDGGHRPEPEPRRAGAWTLLALTKMGALFALVWLLMRYSLVSPIPMLAGFASLPLGIAIGSLVSDRSLRGEH